MRVWWASGFGCGRWEDWEIGKEDHGTGLEKFGALAMAARRRASTCFAFMLPKNKVGAVDLFARTEGGHCARSLQQGSLVFGFSGHLSCNPNPMYLCYFSRARLSNHRPFR